MQVLVTGSKGFIGKNLVIELAQLDSIRIDTHDRDDDLLLLESKINKADIIFHLAGENRPKDEKEFDVSNHQLTKLICQLSDKLDKKIPIIFSSSTQAEDDNPYGKSKLAAETVLRELEQKSGCSVVIYRLPGVFGKWSKPNYNSVVATFCFNIASKLPIQINDPNKILTLVYIDDIVKSFINNILHKEKLPLWGEIKPKYSITIQALANQLQLFADSRTTLITERVGCDLTRALYATYLSFLPPDKFTYDIPFFPDKRGVFAEVLKTHDSGQFSFFTTLPGITRGQHFHNSKSEKFIIIKGKAKFRFRHLITNDRLEIFSSSDKLTIVETIPGWVHDITNVGENEMIAMLWANEIFDREQPDTISSEV
jgi:UDP-2-acetamido-2,6-beta-L-arabino-hexul-4-ose reductase